MTVALCCFMRTTSQKAHSKTSGASSSSASRVSRLELHPGTKKPETYAAARLAKFQDIRKPPAQHKPATSTFARCIVSPMQRYICAPEILTQCLSDSQPPPPPDNARLRLPKDYLQQQKINRHLRLTLRCLGCLARRLPAHRQQQIQLKAT